MRRLKCKKAQSTTPRLCNLHEEAINSLFAARTRSSLRDLRITYIRQKKSSSSGLVFV